MHIIIHVQATIPTTSDVGNKLNMSSSIIDKSPKIIASGNIMEKK